MADPRLGMATKARRAWGIGGRRHPSSKSPAGRLELAQETFLAFCIPQADEGDLGRVLDRLRAEADPLVGEGEHLAVEVFLARGLTTLVAEGYVDHLTMVPLARRLCAEAQVSPVAVGLRVLGDPQLLLLPLEESVDAVLALLEALGPISAPSVWVRATPAPRLLRWRSEVPSLAVPALVDRVLAGASSASAGTWTAVPIRSFERPTAALVVSAEPEHLAQATALIAPLERLLGRAFERANLSASNADQSAALVRSSERRLTRVGFDLHDGPLQDVALLSGELAGVRSAMLTAMARQESVATVVDRVDDLTAMVSCLEANLREVANSLDSVGELRRPFQEMLNVVLRAFSLRSTIEASVQIAGEVDGLSDSQRITLLRVVQETLNNVREHSGARNVSVSIKVGPTQVEALIQDDGDGFDVEPALRDAARRGRMGLLGIVERVRLLGGFCDIASKPGEGCCVSLTVARWTPEMASLARESVAS